MSAERALLRRVKVLLECSNMEPLQRQTDLIVGEIKELLAQTDQEPEAWMLIDKETGARIPKAYKPEHGVNKDRWELYPLFASPPKQPESTAEAIMPNGVCISNVYAAYEEGRKSVMSEQEPVAWIIETEIYGKLSEWVCTDKKHYMEEHDGAKDPIPLYLAPPKRTPLSNEEIDKGLNGKNGFENWYDDRFVDGVRFAEKHHGIGVDDE
jgi:hypothetical protein